jgi:CHAD domain-containing protein
MSIDARAEPARPASAAPPEDFGVLLCNAACRELEQAGHLLGYHASHLHHGVHQGRKCLRRARAALALAAPVLGRGGWLIDHELRRILHALSDLRDGQALVEVLERGAARLPPEHAPLLARAIRTAQARRAEMGRRAGGVAARQDQREMIAMLRAAVPGLPWQHVDVTVVRHALDESHAAFAKAFKTVHAKPDDDAAWHRWRRRARRQSQQHRLVAHTSLAVDREREKAFAEKLGGTQDLSLLLAHCGRDSPFGDDDRRALAAGAAGGGGGGGRAFGMSVAGG